MEVLRSASSPEHGYGSYHWPQSRAQIYQTASALALVSSGVRQAVMPHLLHTVILNTQATVTLFLRTVDQQKTLYATRSRLEIDYTKCVRRIWSTDCYQPFAEQSEVSYHDYRMLYDLFCKADMLGFGFNSLHLLYEVLGGTQLDSLTNWTCNRVTFAGTLPMWNPVPSTNAGLAFIKHITHLTLWSTRYSVFGDTPSDIYQVPNWTRSVPFHLMPNLTNFAFTLIKAQGSATTTVVVYTLPLTNLRQFFLSGLWLLIHSSMGFWPISMLLNQLGV